MRIRPIRDRWWLDQASSHLAAAIAAQPSWKTADLIRVIRREALGLRKATTRDSMAINLLAALDGELVVWDRETRMWRPIT